MPATGPAESVTASVAASADVDMEAAPLLTTSTSNASVNAQQEHAYMDTLAQLRSHMFEDIAVVAPDALPTAVVRRSTRARAAPEVYKPAWAVTEQGRMSSVEDEIEETREGEDFQAVLPAVQPRPARIPADEQAWLQPPILTGIPGKPTSIHHPPPLPDIEATTVQQRVAWMVQGRAALEDALPRSAQKPLGLHLIGEAVGQGWSDAEAQQFEEGMLLLGRDFPAIRKQFLPQRETKHLVLYYYNVWKTQSTARAQAWYCRLEEERVQAAEALRVEAQLKRAALERDHMRRLEAVRDSNRRKTLRDAVAWLRQAARTPHEANMHRTKPREVISRGMQARACEAWGPAVSSAAPRQ